MIEHHWHLYESYADSNINQKVGKGYDKVAKERKKAVELASVDQDLRVTTAG